LVKATKDYSGADIEAVVKNVGSAIASVGRSIVSGFRSLFS
jgi:predicted RND superfamily exporter protein